MINVKILTPMPIDVDIEESKSIGIDILSTIVVRSDAEHYEGDYEIIPDRDAIELATKNRFLTDNVTVTGVPKWEMDNPTGTTVYIGGSKVIYVSQ